MTKPTLEEVFLNKKITDVKVSDTNREVILQLDELESVTLCIVPVDYDKEVLEVLYLNAITRKAYTWEL